MSSVANAIGIALQSINAINRQINITSDNIANATNEEYNHRSAALESRREGGVIISGVTRAVNSSLRRSEISAYSETQNYSARNDVYQSIENFLGTNFDTTILGNSLQGFEDAWRDFQATPELPGVEKNILNAADDFVHELTRLNEQLLDLEVNLIRQTTETVSELNETLNEIHRINSNIAFNQDNPDLVSHYNNQLEPLITKLAGFASIKTTQSSDGRTYIFSDNASLISSTPAQFAYNPTTDTLTRSDIPSLTKDYSRLLNGGSLEALIKLNSSRSSEVSSTNYNEGIVNKMRNQLDNLAYLFYTDGVATSDFSTNVVADTNGNIVYENSGIQAGVLSIQVFDDTNTLVGGVTSNITATTTFDNLVGQFDALSAATQTTLSYDRTAAGQFVLKGVNDGAGENFLDGYRIRITDTTGIFYTDNTAHDFLTDDPPGFSYAYNSAANNDTRNELNSDFFEKIVETNPFSVGNLRVNDQLSIRVNPPAIKRSAANPVVDAFVGSTRNINNSGLSGQNYTYREIATGFVNNILAESRSVTENRERTQQIYEQTHIDLRNDVGVNLDTELARLTVLQNAYSATARVISVSDQLLSELINLAR